MVRASMVIAVLLASCAVAQPLEFTGTNFAGGEFYEPKDVPEPVYGRNFVYPTVEQLDWCVARGINIIRVCFRWETLQPAAGAELRVAEVERLQAIAEAARERGITVLLDPHNYARYFGEVASGGTFADFWRRLASAGWDAETVWFGLMNEPYGIAATEWLVSANAAIAAIREAGATNRILVPGTAYTGAHSWLADWYGGANGIAMVGVEDPLDNYAFEVHQYLDGDSSGTSAGVVSPTVGSERLRDFVAWCREHGKRGFLGEFAVPAGDEGGAALEDMLASMERDRDVWLGFTWWAAGAWWGDYLFSLEPKDGIDRPQMEYLAPHLQPHD